MYRKVVRFVLALLLLVRTVRDRFPSHALTQEEKLLKPDSMYSAFLIYRWLEIPFLFWLLYCEVCHLLSNEQSSLTAYHVAGAITFIIGDMIRSSAKNELGHLFTYEIGIRSDHHLITTGPYAYLVHPSYTGAALKGIGLVLYFQSFYLLGIHLFRALFTHSRIFIEEEMLLKEFGEEFVKFRDSNWRLVPFLF